MSFRALLLLQAALLLGAGSLHGQTNWPQFRGPHGNGQAEAKGIPTTLNETENCKWKTPLAGKAWSSPVVWGNQIWLTNADELGTELSVLCLDRETGKILRDEILFRVAAPQAADRFNSYASPTPVLEEGRVYVTWGSPGTACLDTQTGKVLWQRTDLECNHYRGPGSSPIVWQDLLIMNFDGSDFQYVIALDKRTGQTVWKTNRSIDYGDLDPATGKPVRDGDFRKAFSTPHVAEVNGKPVLFSSGAKAHYAYDPLTGKELWRMEERAQHSAATRPVLGHGLAFFLTGFGKGQLLAVKIPPYQNIPAQPAVLSESDLAWRIKKGIPNKPSLLLKDDLIFFIDDNGIAGCIEAATGNELWRQRVQGNYSASPLLIGDNVYAFSEEGKVAVFHAGREWKLVAENKLPEGIMASPAVAHGALFIRTKAALYCFAQK